MLYTILGLDNEVVLKRAHPKCLIVGCNPAVWQCTNTLFYNKKLLLILPIKYYTKKLRTRLKKSKLMAFKREYEKTKTIHLSDMLKKYFFQLLFF